MKKIALLLAALFVLTAVLTACNGDSPENPSESQSAPSAEASSAGESSADASEPSEDPSEEPSSKEPDESQPPEVFTHATKVSSGKPYTTSVVPGESYPDSYGSELTDGLYALSENADYTDEKFVGYAPGNDSYCNIAVDLGEITDRIYEFRVSYISIKIAGISPAKSVTVYRSDDGEKWTRTGRCVIPSYVDGTTQEAVLILDNSISARYIRFNVQKSSAWLFIDEVTVIADIESGETEKEQLDSLDGLYGTEKLTSAERAAALAKISGEAPDRSLYRVNVASGCAYRLNPTDMAIDPRYPDTEGKMLTDGITSGYLEGGTWVGLSGGKQAEIELTLKSVMTNIAGFELHAYNNRVTGTAFPLCVTVLVSTDRSTWTEAGRVYAPADTSVEIFSFTLELEKQLKARYVKFVLSETDCDLFMIEEASVIAYTSEREEQTLYPVISIPDVTSDILWQSGSTDYNATQNLLFGLKPQISCLSDVPTVNWANNTPITSNIMNDGVHSTSINIHSGGYFKFNLGSQRDIIYDLTRLSSVSSFTAGFIQRAEWAVYAPSSVKVLLSADGDNWYDAGSMRITYNSEPGKAEGELTLAKPVAARFVCFSFAVGTWTGCDELEAFGTKRIASDTAKLASSGLDTAESFMRDSYLEPSPEILGGVEDLYLVYHGTDNARTEKDLLPLLAYTDKDGKMTDTMFDGFLFLMTGNFPSGNGGFAAFSMSDGEWLTETLFNSTQNIGALESAAGKAKTALGLDSDYKYKFYITLYYPKYGMNFGDLDGNGKSDLLNSYEKRMSAVKWYIDRVEAELAVHDYDNIEFAGYYWYDESMNPNPDDNDRQILNGVSELVHEVGSQLFWIPYYVAPGYSEWSEYGFDAAVMQPNYAFGLDRPYAQIINTAALAKRYGMGIEIEMDGKAFANDGYYDRYMDYLKSGIYYGYMDDCVHMYYMGTDYMARAAEASGKYRLLYDYTYQFIKGTLKIIPDVRKDVAISVTADTPFRATLNAESSETEDYVIRRMPSHGTVTLEADGSYSYYPDKGFTGSDSFSYAYAEKLDYSDECTVNVTVG